MSAPIPLTAPDGTVYAYACGQCRRTASGALQFGPRRDDHDNFAELSLRRATMCCVCQCGAAVGAYQTECSACFLKREKKNAAWQKAQRAARAKSRAARGVQECSVCDGTRMIDLGFAECHVCGGTGEVPL